MSAKKKLLLGVFLVGGVLLFSFGLFLIGSRKQIFASHFTVYTEMVKMDTMQAGGPVRVAGMDAGQVTDIQIPKTPASKFRLTLELDEKFHPIVRQDSTTAIQTAGMVGSKYVDISQGSQNSPECPAGATLPSYSEHYESKRTCGWNDCLCARRCKKEHLEWGSDRK